MLKERLFRKYIIIIGLLSVPAFVLWGYKSLIFNFGDDKMLPNLLVVSEQPIPEFSFINQYYDTITNDL